MIEMNDIIKLYKKCNLDGNGNVSVRKEINTGTLGNKLNQGTIRNSYNNSVSWSGSSMSRIKG